MHIPYLQYAKLRVFWTQLKFNRRGAMKLLKAKELAGELGRSEWWVCQAKKAGMPFFCGVITLPDAVKWMREHPDFTALDYSATPSSTGRGRPRKGVGRCDGPFRTRVRRNASPAIEERPTAPGV